MAKNNFKKKKTLKRSFRRNYTKKVASASLGSRTLNIRKKNRRSQKQRTTLRNKRNTRAKVGGGWLSEPSKEELQTAYYIKILPNIKKISEEMLSVTNKEKAIDLFDQVNELIDTPPGLSNDDERNAQYPVMRAWKIVRAKHNWPDTIYRWHRKMDTAEYHSNFYTPAPPSRTSRELMSDTPIEPLSVDDTTSKSTNPTSLSSITPQNIPSPSGDPLPVDVLTSKPTNPTPLFSVTQRHIPPSIKPYVKH
jgi:hypothetical protein